MKFCIYFRGCKISKGLSIAVEKNQQHELGSSSLATKILITAESNRKIYQQVYHMETVAGKDVYWTFELQWERC